MGPVCLPRRRRRDDGRPKPLALWRRGGYCAGACLPWLPAPAPPVPAGAARSCRRRPALACRRCPFLPAPPALPAGAAPPCLPALPVPAGAARLACRRCPALPAGAGAAIGPAGVTPVLLGAL
ncbi:MAG: hypothetical protein M0005_01100 [Actinomycetota bacterium]|nr:hypothetical protein [Actinomycetota bacterium]